MLQKFPIPHLKIDFLKFVLLSLGLMVSLEVQSQKYAYTFRNKPLSYALETIGKEQNLKIAYDAVLARNMRINGKFTGGSVVDLLSDLLQNSSLEVGQVGGVYVIKVKEEQEQPGLQAISINPVEQPTYKIWGAITDVESGERLPYAYIYSSTGKVSATANADGFFSITVHKDEPLELCISYLGFEKRCINVTPMPQAGMLTIPLERVQTTLSGITIRQKQNYLVQVPVQVSTNTLNPRAATDVPTLNPLDFTAPLQMLPGVDATTESAIGLNIRKSPSDQTQVLFDGFTIYHLNHFLGQISAFNTKAIKDIQVYKGGFGARYGGSASAILEITSKSGNRYRPNFSVGADLISADAFADVPITKKLGFVLAARRSYTDVYQTSLYNNLFEKLRTDLAATSLTSVSSFQAKFKPDYNFFDIHSKLIYNPDSTQEISLTFYTGSDNMDLLDAQPRSSLSENSDISNYGVGLKWSRQFASKFFLRASVGFSDYSLEFDHLNSVLAKKVDVEIARRQNKLDNHISDLTAKVEGETRLSPAISLFIGGVGTSISSGYSFRTYREELFQIQLDTLRHSSYYGNIFTGYSELNISKGFLKAFTPGFRVTYFTPNKQVYFEPRVQATLGLLRNLNLKLAAGRYLQFVNRIPISYLGDYNSYWMVADGGKMHPVVSSNHFVGGFTYDATSNIQFDIEGYLKNTSGITSLNVNPVFLNQKIQLQQKLISSSMDVRGVDFLAKYLFERGQMAIAYSLSESNLEVENRNKLYDYPSSIDQLHEFKIFSSYKFWKFNISAAWVYGSGKPWDEILLSNSLALSPDYIPNSQRLAAYHRLDLSLSYKQRIGRTNLMILVSAFNAYDRRNVLRRPYSLSEAPIQDAMSGGSPFVYEDITGFGFTPTVYISCSF